MRKISLLRSAVLAVGCSLSLAVAAQSGEPKAINIPPGELVGGLQALTRQAGVELAYREDLLSGLRTKGASGTLTPAQALERLLEGTGFTGKRDPSGALMILENGAQVPPTAPEPPVRDKPAAARSTDVEIQDLDKFMVTGSRIRGGSTPSPVVRIGIEQIREEGFADLGDVIRSVPQNFSGGQNPGVAGGATAGSGGLANQNISGGSSLNLRGLGPDASLTLLNGRRMSYGGFLQAVDISAIPVEAVERIDIVTDGASAIYGSDAVGGVANVILRRDHDGVSVGARYGGATGGGATTREYAVTAGANWLGGGILATYKDVSVDPVYAPERDYTRHMFPLSTLWPESDQRSGLFSAHQAIGNAAELYLDTMRTERSQLIYPYNDWARPYYAVRTPDSTSTLVAPGLDLMLPNDWTLQLGATMGKDRLVNRQTHVTIATGAATQMSHECFCNDLRVYEVGAEGPLFALSGGEARLAVGAGYRKNRFFHDNYLAGSTAVQGDESSRFAYAEVSLPLVSTGSGVSGVRRLELSAAVRTEDYDSFGRTTTPKIGLIYSPGTDMTFKASWGRSYKAPTLFQRYQTQQAILYPASYFGGTGYPGDATILTSGGGNPDLTAERAKTWSASLVLHPQALPGLDAVLTWFDIDYTDRVIQPLANFSQALGNPDYDQFISYAPTVGELERVLAAAGMFYNLAGADYDPATVVAIPYSHYTNVARQRIQGIDLSASYRMDLAAGRLSWRGSASWLDSSQQAIPTAEPHELAGTIFSPAKFNARLGAVWSQDGMSLSGFANHTSGVTNNLVAGRSEESASFTTFDITVRYESPHQAGPWSGLGVTVSAQNLFDRAPPLYTPIAPANPPYDSTNYSAIGRFLSLSVSKRF